MKNHKIILDDKWLFILNVLVILTTWFVLGWLYPRLPVRIPLHFGTSNLLTETYVIKNFWTGFFSAHVQLVATIIFFVIYRRSTSPVLSEAPVPHTGLEQKYVLQGLRRVRLLVGNIGIDLALGFGAFLSLSEPNFSTFGLTMFFTWLFWVALVPVVVYYSYVARILRGQISSRD